MGLVKNISNFIFGDADFFRFQYPAAFYLLLVLLLLLAWSFWKSKQFKKQTQHFVGQGNPIFLTPNSIKKRNVLKFTLWIIGLLFLIIGLANMQFGLKKEEVKHEGVDLIFALDVSKSMLAEDFKPNRLARAKYAIGDIIDQLASDRIAIVVFAGDAYLQLPLTNDHAAAKMYLESIDTDIIPVQGTSVSAALEKSLAAFPKSSKNSKGRSIVLISDGEDHEEEAIKMAEKCAEEGIKLYTLGIGTPQGSTIPEFVNGRKVGLKKDGNGSTVVTKINENLLIELAEKGKGKYVRGSNADLGLMALFDEIRGLEKNEYGAKKFTLYENRFVWFLVIGLLCIVLELLIFNHQLLYKK